MIINNLKIISLSLLLLNITINIKPQPKWPFRKTPSPTMITIDKIRKTPPPKPIIINPKITEIIIDDLVKYIENNSYLTYGKIINIIIHILNEFTHIETENREQNLKAQIKKFKNEIYRQMYIDLENREQYVRAVCFDEIVNNQVKLTIEKIITCIYQIFEM